MPSTPSIRISADPRRSSPTGYTPFPPAVSPMAIPWAREPVPPPLPPPTWIPDISPGQDPGWQWGNDPNGVDFGRPASVKAGSSLLGTGAKGSRPSMKEQDVAMMHYAFDDTARRGSSISTVTAPREQDSMDETFQHSDEDGPSIRLTSNGLHGERQLEQRALEQSSQSYDKHLLSRIGGPNTPTRGSLSHSPGGLQENGQLVPNDRDRRHSSLRPLSMPERRQNSIDSPCMTRWSSTSAAISPGHPNFWQEQGAPETNHQYTVHRGSLASEDSSSHRGSYDQSMFPSDDLNMEDGQMSTLNIHDRSPGSPKAGSKRRASSPQRDREDRLSISSAPGPNEIYHRRSMQQLPNRGSPIFRFHPNHSSVSSASSSGLRHGSLGSSLGVSSVPSSATSYASGRLSPGALSPATTDAEAKYGTPYPANNMGNPASPVARHSRTASESNQSGGSKQSADSVAHSRNGSLSSHMQGMFICDCCPKKPKKFDTQEDLRLHESEKQYMCNYCPNRFKNKNEAERHQNSLHLRKHSWSCAALTGIESAFHSAPNNTDVCGYCGNEFPNPPQWDVRADHLNHVHKFGECNHQKKFYRADHFRQHLKHSHQGTSGKWTNMLENACMKDECPPERRPVIAVGEASAPPPALMVTTSGLAGSTVGARIEETPHET